MPFYNAVFRKEDTCSVYVPSPDVGRREPVTWYDDHAGTNTLPEGGSLVLAMAHVLGWG